MSVYQISKNVLEEEPGEDASIPGNRPEISRMSPVIRECARGGDDGE